MGNSIYNIIITEGEGGEEKYNSIIITGTSTELFTNVSGVPGELIGLDDHSIGEIGKRLIQLKRLILRSWVVILHFFFYFLVKIMIFFDETLFMLMIEFF